jgi:hypothetical protein
VSAPKPNLFDMLDQCGDNLHARSIALAYLEIVSAYASGALRLATLGAEEEAYANAMRIHGESEERRAVRHVQAILRRAAKSKAA